MTRALRTLALLVALSAPALADEAAAVEAALAADDSCLAQGGEDCGLELRQLRGELKVSAVKSHDPDDASDVADDPDDKKDDEDGDAAKDSHTDDDSLLEQKGQEASGHSAGAFTASMELAFTAGRQALDATGQAPGQCMGPADQKIWQEWGQKDFDDVNEKCGRQCGAGVPCTADCLHKKGYSTGCADCMAKLVACTLPNCLNQCVTGRNPKCDACMKAKCRPPFKACSGLDAGGH